MTQKDLAQKLNEKPATVHEFEAGTAIVNQTVLSKMERILGVKLRGKNKGEPFSQGKKNQPGPSGSR